MDITPTANSVVTDWSYTAPESGQITGVVSVYQESDTTPSIFFHVNGNPVDGLRTTTTAQFSLMSGVSITVNKGDVVTAHSYGSSTKWSNSTGYETVLQFTPFKYKSLSVGADTAYFSMELNYDEQVDITPTSSNPSTYEYTVSSSGVILGYLRSTIAASTGAPIIYLRRNGVNVQGFGSSSVGDVPATFNSMGPINVPVEAGDVIALNAYHSSTQLDLPFCSLKFVPYKYGPGVVNPQLSHELDYDNAVTVEIPATSSPTSGEVEFISYTAPSNGVVNVRTNQNTDNTVGKWGAVNYYVMTAAGEKFTLGYSGPLLVNSNGSVATDKIVKGMWHRRVELNKGDTIVGFIGQDCLGISEGQLIFFPYKYVNNPVTVYTQGELAAIAADASQPDYDNVQTITTPLSGVEVTTPGNGWIHVRLIDNSLLNGQEAMLGLTCGDYGIDDYDTNPNVELRCAEDSTFAIYYSGLVTQDNIVVRFIPVKGTGKLYSQTYTKDEIAEIAAWGIAPSSSYKDVEMPTWGSQVTYTADGYGYISIQWEGANDCIVAVSSMGVSQKSASFNGGTGNVSLYVGKGAEYSIFTGGTSATAVTLCRFIYANSSVPK